MRIVAYTNLYMPMCRAGAQTMLRDMLRPLRKRHQIVIVVHDGRGRTEPYVWEGIPVFPDSGRAIEQGLVRSADLIITHIQATLPAVRIAEECDIPIIQIMHGDYKADREFLRHRCDCAVFNSHWLRDSFPEYDGRAAVVYPPVRPGEYRTTPGDAVSLVNVARIKGSGTFYALAEEFDRQPFLGVIGGYGEQEIRDLPNVSIMQSIDDMTQVYGRTRVLLMPSDYESFGRCAVEAAASGIPTIAAPTPGLREALGDAGIYCDTGDHDAWRAALRELSDPVAWQAASARALRRSGELAAISANQMARWLDIIDSLDGARVAG